MEGTHVWIAEGASCCPFHRVGGKEGLQFDAFSGVDLRGELQQRRVNIGTHDDEFCDDRVTREREGWMERETEREGPSERKGEPWQV
jgi:hypothetical protein